MKIDFSDLEKTLNELVEKHSDKIKDNESFVQLLNKLSKSNDDKNAIIEEMAEVMKLMQEQITSSFTYSKLLNTRLSALETAVAHNEKGNEKWLELVDNLQGQIDILYLGYDDE